MAVDIETIGVAIETSGLVSGKAALNDVEQAANRAADATDKLSQRSTTLDWQNKQMAQSSKTATDSAVQHGYAQQVLAQRELEAADAADKFMQKLQQQVSQVGKTRTEILGMQAAMHGVSEDAGPMIAALEKAAEGGHSLNFATAGASRELMVLSHEMASGNYSKFGGSMMVLAKQTGAAGMIFSGTGLAIAGILAPLGLFAFAAYKGHEEAVLLNNTLIETGNYAGLTADGFDAMASRIAGAAHTGIGTGKEALMALTGTGRLTGEAMEVLGTVMVQQSKITGQSLDDISKDYAKMPDGVAKWAEEHNKSMHFIGLAQYEHIRLLEQQGKTQEAMIEVGKALAAQFDGHKQKLGYLASAWQSAGQAASWAWDKMMGFGRPETTSDTIDKTSQAVTNARSKLDRLSGLGNGKDNQLAMASAQRELQSALFAESMAQSKQLEDRKFAAFTAERAQVNQLGIAADEHIQKQLQSYDKVRAMNAAIRAQQLEFDQSAAAGKTVSTGDQKTILDGIREQYASKKQLVDVDQQLLVSTMDGMAAMRAESESATKLTPVQREIATLYEKIANSKSQYKLSTLLAVDAMMQEKLAMEAMNNARDDAVKNNAQLIKDGDRMVASGDKEVETLQKQVDAQRLKNSEIGKTKDQIGEILAAKELLSAANDDEMAQNLRAAAEYAGPLHTAYLQYAADLEKAAKLKREMAGLKVEGAAAQTAADAAKKAEAQWHKTSEEINRTMTDALMRAFESGSGFGQAFVKTIEDMFKTMVLRPIISAVMSPVSAGINSVLGGQGGAGSTMNQLGNGASVYNVASGGMAGVGSMVSTAGNFAGSASISAYGAGMGLSSATASTAAAAYTEAAATIVESNAALAATYTEVASSLTAGSTVATGMSTALAAIPVWGWIAMALATQLGGPKIDQVGDGLSGTLSASGSSVQKRTDFVEDHHGLFGMGAFTTHNSSYSDASAGTSDYINAAVMSVTTATKGYASAIGLSASAVDGFTKQMDVTLTGLDATAAKAAIDKAISGFVDDMVTSAYGGALAALAQGNETASTTLQRVATEFVTVNGAMSQLGGTLFQVSTAGAAAADGLVQAMGGLANFQTQTTDYVKNFFTATQQKDMTVANITNTLNAAGGNFTSDQIAGASRADFVNGVNGIDKSTPAGQKLYAAAMSVEGAFAGITQSTDQVAAAAAKATAAISGGSGGGYGGGGGGGTSLVSAFQSLTDSIFAEVQRIRGLVAGTGAVGYAQSQTQFAIATAQSRAGDQAATAALPQLSQTMLTLAEANAKTLIELQTIRAQTASSLSTTGTMLAGQYGLTIPSFDVGTNMLPQDMIAMVHKGEAIVPAAYNPAAGGAAGSGNADVVAELRATRAENKEMRKDLARIKDILTRVTPTGNAMSTTTATA